MSTETAIAIKLGIDSLLALWAALEKKPAGWIPSNADWQKLADAVDAATPEQRYLLAQARANMFARRAAAADGATKETN